MPIYEYHCRKCETRFEALVPIAHRDEVACEKCGAQKVERLASTFMTNAASDGADFGSSGAGSCCGRGGCGHCGD